MTTMSVSLAWYGVSTFRLQVDDTVVFLDAYVDRVPDAPPVGLSAAQIERADAVLVGHAHFDHLAGAETIARNTGARVIGSYEAIRLVSDAGVPAAQLTPVAGGEPLELAPDVRVRVFPGLHSCIWSSSGPNADDAAAGDLGVSHEQRLERLAEPRGALPPGLHSDRGDGGALGYLIETRHGSIWWSDTSGYWSGVLRALQPEVAILAAAGRGNVDGEPVQGSLAGFLSDQIGLLRPRRVVFCHHDDWYPAMTRGGLDIGPVVRRLRTDHGARLDVATLGYDEPRPILDALPS
jgi:L-ascorbate metabolism protein UlaG (beta-lactamase superfamily)